MPDTPGRPPGAECYTDTTELTVEEQRLDAPLPGTDEPAARRFVEAAGFDTIVDDFARRLCDVAGVDAATRTARAFGSDLWDLAVRRAQGRVEIGTIDRYDDRPLYWARLYMTRALREWAPEFDLSRLQRLALVRILDYASRGIDSVEYPAPGAAKRLLVSGFDTFSLDADLIMTISQGRRGRMDIEQWAGGFRGGFPDNNRALHYGPISAAALWPQPQPSPQWIETTLPHQRMTVADTRPWPVRLNDGICEWPAGTYPDPGSIRCADDPAPGSRAASAPGGNYLSNESMYRTNRLRLGARLYDLPGGHLHISSLVYPDDESVLTSPAFEKDRKATVDQTVALVDAAGRAVLDPAGG